MIAYYYMNASKIYQSNMIKSDKWIKFLHFDIYRRGHSPYFSFFLHYDVIGEMKADGWFDGDDAPLHDCDPIDYEGFE